MVGYGISYVYGIGNLSDINVKYVNRLNLTCDSRSRNHSENDRATKHEKQSNAKHKLGFRPNLGVLSSLSENWRVAYHYRYRPAELIIFTTSILKGLGRKGLWLKGSTK